MSGGEPRAGASTAPGSTPLEATFVEKDVVDWAKLETLVKQLAEQVRGEYDVMLCITRGGLVPAGMLAYLLGIRDILVAAVAFYDEHGQVADQPMFFQFPSDPLLHGKRVLIVDEVWDTGTTIQAVIERVRMGGGIPTTAVLHYKPERSKVRSVPDHFAVSTDAWVVYPFKYGK
ncbi:MAG TPA: phosphoribosyltransferase family protein [Candidatus Binatia bacterium]|nr:phosphoribosyltransferase family protein [Candidatus Binatia bacterium]